MEVFSLLKYWKGGGRSSGSRMCASTTTTTTTSTTTITASVPQEAYETEDSDDEGPFFDLEFTVPTDEDEKEEEAYEEEEEEEEGSEEREGDGDTDVRVLSRKTAARQSHANLDCSSSEDLFFKGGIVPLESSFPDLNPCDPNSGKRQQFPVSLLRSTTKFRVFFLGFKKVKTSDAAVTTPSDHKQQQQQQQSRLFTVKFKVKKVPIISLFSRKNSRRRSSGCKMHQQQVDDDAPASEGGKRPARDLMEKYLKMIKPFYIRRVVSRRNAGKEDDNCARDAALSRSKSTSSSSSNSNSNKTQTQIHHSQSLNQNQTSLPTRLRVVCRHLGKSRSAPSSTSAAAAAVTAAPLPPHLQIQRRDDSLLQQQDGIQGAIAHCKRPFNASSKSKDSELSCGESEKDAYT